MVLSSVRSVKAVWTWQTPIISEGVFLMKAKTYQAAKDNLAAFLTKYDATVPPQASIFKDRYTLWDLDSFLESLYKPVRMPVEKVIEWIKEYGYDAYVEGLSYLYIEAPQYKHNK